MEPMELSEKIRVALEVESGLPVSEVSVDRNTSKASAKIGDKHVVFGFILSDVWGDLFYIDLDGGHMVHFDKKRRAHVSGDGKSHVRKTPDGDYFMTESVGWSWDSREILPIELYRVKKYIKEKYAMTVREFMNRVN